MDFVKQIMKALEQGETHRWEIPKTEKERTFGFQRISRLSALLILLAGVYTGLYRVDDSVKELGKILLIIFALYAPVKVENMILGGGIIRSGGNTKIIMIIDIVGTWCIGIPLCLFAAYVFKWGIVGVYTLLTTEELFRLAVSLIIFRRRKWIISLC